MLIMTISDVDLWGSHEPDESSISDQVIESARSLYIQTFGREPFSEEEMVDTLLSTEQEIE